MDNPAQRTAGRTLDHAAGLYDILSPLVTLGREPRLHRQVVELLDLGDGQHVLDVGCATGALSARIARTCLPLGGSVVGIDAAAKMIAAARRKHGDQPNLVFEAALAEELPYANGSFDRVVSTFFFHHVNKSLKERCLAEMHRVLRPGGRVLVVDVDAPTHWFGSFCAWSGYLLFRQPEIRENIEGVLRDAFASSAFASWRQVGHQLGYVSLFMLERG
ncbi:MAG: methyltransferase domain-containing protein [Lentisphaeria bacterium]|jgi:ubiquinone/menaquinone biosynthesis C-methylase UbiE|nr:methyltransferase domain-containing protein [Lentisphaeria bacterium]